ncbi:MAG: S26 family signal peptidase [Myxococcaceae bacterium]
MKKLAKRVTNKIAEIQRLHRIEISIIALLTVLFVWFLNGYEFVLNHSESLPLKAIIIKKNKLPVEKGDIFVFYVRNNPAYQSKEVKFIKMLGGSADDVISIKASETLKTLKTEESAESPLKTLLVNGAEIGKIKTESLKGMALHQVSEGKIPPHKFFAYTTHTDSYDSRYSEIGLIDEKDIIGTAVFVF